VTEALEVSMSSLTNAVRRSTAGLALVTMAAACRSGSHLGPAPASDRLSDAERVTHVLSRLTFGPRAGDAERVTAMGVDRWIEEQLHPESIPDTALTRVLASIPDWRTPTPELVAAPRVPASIASTPIATLLKDSAAKAMLAKVRVVLAAGGMNDLFFAGKIAHAEVGNRQLLEVVTDFWENHFSVYSGKMPSHDAFVIWDRDVIRPHALGRFRDLLGATAHSPAMLYYLDNQLSTRRGLNENYARELMELHTLGVDGGYTQKDVQEVARALTGWTFNRTVTGSSFVFRSELHDTGAKVVLGHTLAAGRGIEDGEEVLDILARHPSTAKHIAFKLARRLVSDDPPPTLVERAAATFMQTDGDLTAVVRTIVTSPEFFSRTAFRAKVKTPFELVVSARRAMDAVPDTTPATAQLIARLGQPTFGWLAPDGWPEHGDAWMNSGTMYQRIKFAGDLVEGRVRNTSLTRWHQWETFAAEPLEGQIDGVVHSVLGGYVEPATRALMLDVDAKTENKPPSAGPQRLRDVLWIAFASPEFQRR
jgi:uncharacterized protein (DUF1800 family)